MNFSVTSLSDGEYLRKKEEELEHTLRHADSLRELLTSLRRYVRSQEQHENLPAVSGNRKRPSREERVMHLLRGGPMSTDDLARAFKIQKSEMRLWMDARINGGDWAKTEDNNGYLLMR